MWSRRPSSTLLTTRRSLLMKPTSRSVETQLSLAIRLLHSLSPLISVWSRSSRKRERLWTYTVTRLAMQIPIRTHTRPNRSIQDWRKWIMAASQAYLHRMGTANDNTTSRNFSSEAQWKYRQRTSFTLVLEINEGPRTQVSCRFDWIKLVQCLSFR